MGDGRLKLPRPSGAFLSISRSVALSFFRFDDESTLLAAPALRFADASRWAAKYYNRAKRDERFVLCLQPIRILPLIK